MLDLLEGEGGFVGWEEAVDASKFEKKHQVMSSRVARKMSLKLLSCGRPQLSKFDGKGFRGHCVVLVGRRRRVHRMGGGGSVEIEKELGQCRRESC